MSELEALTAIRAFFPALAALSSLALVPLINFWRGSPSGLPVRSSLLLRV